MYESFSEKTLEKAYEFKTLPIFVYWKSETDVWNISEKILEGVENQKTFLEIMEKIPVEEIKNEWMNYYIFTFSENGIQKQFNTLMLEAEFPSIDIETVLKKPILTKKAKLLFFDFMKKRKDNFKKLDSIVSKYVATDRVIESTSVTIHMFRDENTDLYTLVQRTKITKRVVAIALNDVYKVSSTKHPGNIFPASGCWIKFVCDTVVFIFEDNDEFIFKYVEKIEGTIEKDLIECGALSKPYKSHRLTNVSYFIPNIDICLWYFVDFIMLECSNIAVSEKSLQTVDKWILKFIFSKTLTVRIVEKIVDIHTKPARIFGNELFPIGSHFIKISISKIATIFEEQYVIDSLLKLFTLFDTRKAEIEKAYKFYLPHYNFTKQKLNVEETEQKSNRLLKLLEPSMFVTDYPRKCLHLPRIVNDEEAQSLARQKIQVMQFPLKGEGGRSPKWFACDHHPTAPFPGLRKNPLKNKETFPVLPCCYIGDQSQRRGSEYRIYYNNDYKAVKTRKPNEYVVFTTNRCLPENVFGQIPKEIVQLFPSSIFLQFYRFGVAKVANSFLACIEKATGKILKGSFSSKELNVCRQETGCSVTLENADPSKLISFYEKYFNTRIILFSDDEGIFSFSNRGRCSYLSTSLYNSVVVVMRNSGTVADNLESPQYELLVSVANYDKTKPKMKFTLDELFTLNIAFEAFYNVKYESPPSDMVGQKLDSFGKVKAAIFKDGQEKIFHHYRPYPAGVYVVEDDQQGILDVYKTNLLKARALEHAYHYWGPDVFRSRCLIGSETEYSRVVPEYIGVDSANTVEKLCSLKRRNAKRIASPLFSSQIKNVDDSIVFTSLDAIKIHFNTKEFKYLKNGDIVSFRLCDTIEYDTIGGKMYEFDSHFKVKNLYVWGNEKKLYFIFNNQIYEEHQ